MRSKVLLLTRCFAAAIVFCLSTHGQAVELAVNGGFETGDFTGWQQFPSGGGQQTITTVNPASGAYAANIFNDVDASASLIKQANLAEGQLTAGQAITISFEARGAGVDGGVVFAELFSEISGGGVSLSTLLGGGPLALDPDPNTWKTFVYNENLGPDVSGGATLQLAAITAAIPTSEMNVFFDNVSISVASLVPEPNSFALFGIAGVAIASRRRR